MNRLFCDLHLKVNPKTLQATQKVFDKAAAFGYRKIAASSTLNPEDDAVLKSAALEVGLDFVSRADYKPRSQEDLMRFLRKNRRKYEVICVVCDSKELARQAAKDRRVDLISFSSLDYRKRFFDRQEAELASSSLAALEIDVKPLLVLEGPQRVRFLSSLRREAAIAKEFHVPVVVSSGVYETELMRMPRDLASLCFLFGMGEEEALDAVSTVPDLIVTRNREKLKDSFIAPGITLIKEAKS